LGQGNLVDSSHFVRLAGFCHGLQYFHSFSLPQPVGAPGSTLHNPFIFVAVNAMTDQPRLLVLDDEAELRALLQRYLTQQGFDVRTVADAAQLDRLLARERFDALVLDLMLPGENGLSVCQRLRANGETLPILMLTARGEAVDRIIGLEMGADDYLPKPFEPRELAARLRALLRRQELARRSASVTGAGRIQFGPFELDLANCSLLRDGQPQELTSGEFALLKVLASHPGRALGRERLRDLAFGSDGRSASERSIDVQVMRLRRVIEPDPSVPRYIRTVWGAGYVFVGDVAPESEPA
jgi:two-component system phosphate regulon response regulator OmpR